MSENGSTNNNIPSGFTMSLALVDAIPVLLFSASVIVLALRFNSVLFIIGAVCSAFAGACKVLWKIIIAAKKKNVGVFNKLFKPFMFGGFALVLLSVILNMHRIDLASIWAAVTGVPAVFFFVIGIVGMTAMAVMGARLDKNSAKNNWIEQCTNSAAQLAFFLGIIFCG